MAYMIVSIHAPVRVRRTYRRAFLAEGSFNPRTREGATSSRLNDFYLGGVSIHAPVRVRLSPLGQEHGSPEVSIHAPVRVRQFIAYGVLEMEEFQSTHP